MKRIGIDARMFGSSFTGIGVYVERLLEELGKQDHSELQFVIFSGVENKNAILQYSNKFEFVAIQAGHYSLWEQLIFPWILQRAKLDLVHFPHFNAPLLYRGKSIVTIHDLILSLYPGKSISSWIRGYAYRLTLVSIVKRAAKIITVSTHTKKDLVELMQLDEGRVSVIHNGYDPLFSVAILPSEGIEIRKKYTLGDTPYIAYLGLIREHKNTARLVKAFKLLVDSGYVGNLLLIGKEDMRYPDVRDQVRELSLQGRVLFLGHVDGPDRRVLLQESELYVMPSLYEGFGIPILEAMASGVPVVCSQSTSLPEVAGNAARYFHPLRPDDIARVMGEVLDSPELQKEMISLGREQIKKFSWGKMAKQTLEEYQKVLSFKGHK
jgi:glycosyltransferase involved in cell wall biosynthesis